MEVNTVLFYINTMAAEAGVAALAEMTGRIACVGHTVEEAKIKALFCQGLGRIPDSQNLKNVILLGSYWSRQSYLKEMEYLKNTQVYMYSFGDSSVELHPSVTRPAIVCNGEKAGVGPAEFLISTIKDLAWYSRSFEAVVNYNRNIIDIIDDRALSRNVISTQQFFSGLFNAEATKDLKAVFEQFVTVFSGLVTFDELMEVGRAVVNCHMGMARSRALQNSKEIKTADGKRFRVTVAPELINLTNDALHEQFPECDGSATVSILFTDKEQLQFSFRMYNPETNAQHFARAVGGDGSSTISGGRIPFYVPFPFRRD